MAFNPDYPKYRLTDLELVSLIQNLFGISVGGVVVPGVSEADQGTEDRARLETAFAIVRAESNGYINAVREEKDNPLGGTDRGIWQFNSKAFPNMSDADAYNPYTATQRAATISKNGADFGPWAFGPNSYRGTSRTDLKLTDASAAFRRHADEIMTNAEIRARIDEIGFDTENVTVENRTFVDDINPAAVLAALAGPAGKVLQALGSADWWRRIGIALLGGLLVLAAIIFGNSGNLGKLAKLTPTGAVAGAATK